MWEFLTFADVQKSCDVYLWQLHLELKTVLKTSQRNWDKLLSQNSKPIDTVNLKASIEMDYGTAQTCLLAINYGGWEGLNESKATTHI